MNKIGNQLIEKRKERVSLMKEYYSNNRDRKLFDRVGIIDEKIKYLEIELNKIFKESEYPVCGVKIEGGELSYYGQTRDECESNIRDYEDEIERYDEEIVESNGWKLELEHWENNLRNVDEMERKFQDYLKKW